MQREATQMSGASTRRATQSNGRIMTVRNGVRLLAQILIIWHCRAPTVEPIRLASAMGNPPRGTPSGIRAPRQREEAPPGQPGARNASTGASTRQATPSGAWSGGTRARSPGPTCPRLSLQPPRRTHVPVLKRFTTWLLEPLASAPVRISFVSWLMAPIRTRVSSSASRHYRGTQSTPPIPRNPVALLTMSPARLSLSTLRQAVVLERLQEYRRGVEKGGARARIRTWGLPLRRRSLYPTELHARSRPTLSVAEG